MDFGKIIQTTFPLNHFGEIADNREFDYKLD